MSNPTPLLGDSGPAICFLCDSADCNHLTTSSSTLFDEVIPLERSYRVKVAVIEDNQVRYAVGQVIALEEAVAAHLPGAIEMAGARAVKPSENRAHAMGENR